MSEVQKQLSNYKVNTLRTKLRRYVYKKTGNQNSYDTVYKNFRVLNVAVLLPFEHLNSSVETNLSKEKKWNKK